MIEIRLILTIFVALTIGTQAYNIAFESKIWNASVVLSLVICIIGSLLSGLLVWIYSPKWLRPLFDRDLIDNECIYSETGGAFCPLILGTYWRVTWPFARFIVCSTYLEVKVMGKSFKYVKNEGIRLKRRQGIISSGLEIFNDIGVSITFGSININRLINKLRSFGYEVEE
jgi:hypothetical protein